MQKQRCPWVNDNPLMMDYHDKEWGTPLHDDQKLFEYLILDAFQAGLSWNTIINKRKNFQKAFNNFNPEKIANYTQKDKERLMQDAGIIRNRLKIESAIINAKSFLQIQEEFGSFDKYIWQFINHKTINNQVKTIKDYQSKTKESDAMSKSLKEKGFKFVGSTICYAFMQAAGMVNDHSEDCFRKREILNEFSKNTKKENNTPKSMAGSLKKYLKNGETTKDILKELQDERRNSDRF